MDTQPLYDAIHTFRRHKTIASVGTSAAEMLLPGALSAFALLVAFKITGVPASLAPTALIALLVAVLVGAIRGWRRCAWSDYAVAKQIDQELKLDDRLANAYFLLNFP